MCELPKIYEQCHDKPFQLPHKVQEAVRGLQNKTESDSTPEVGINLYREKILHFAI